MAILHFGTQQFGRCGFQPVRGREALDQCPEHRSRTLQITLQFRSFAQVNKLGRSFLCEKFCGVAFDSLFCPHKYLTMSLSSSSSSSSMHCTNGSLFKQTFLIPSFFLSSRLHNYDSWLALAFAFSDNSSISK